MEMMYWQNSVPQGKLIVAADVPSAGQGNCGCPVCRSK